MEPVDSKYPVVMDHAVERVLAAAESLDELNDNPDHPSAWKNCDFVALQVRKLCELFLLGSSLAHVEDGHDQFDLKEWHPDKAFKQLQQLNDNPMAIPMRMATLEGGERQLQPVSMHLPNDVLGTIYGRCGDLLHIPSAHRILKGKVGEFDIQLFASWIRGFHRLLECHAILVPQIQTVYLCIWSGKSGEKVQCNRLAALGPSTFSTDGLPQFDLLAV